MHKIANIYSNIGRRLLMILTVLLLLTSTTPVWSQIMLEGVVTDGATGEPMPSANLIVTNRLLGTTTSDDGSFVLTVPKTTHLLYR
jgi:hypothetical protein